MTERTLREALESAAEAMGEPIDWSYGGVRKSFGGEYWQSSIDMEARVDTDMKTMEVSILTRVTFRQRTCDEPIDAVKYAQYATEAAAMAYAIEYDIGSLRWAHEEHRALYEKLSEEVADG